MPITRKQFELEIDPKIEEMMKTVHAFLDEHRDQAFTRGELRKSLGIRGVISEGAKALEIALETLLEIGGAEKRRVRGQDYYSYGPKPLEL